MVPGWSAHGRGGSVELGYRVAVVGYASRWRHGTHRFFPWVAERVPPFYIWHQTVIMLVALPVIAWIANPVLGFGVIALVSLVATWP